jgi:ketosteroid isomerase-like protein
MFSAEGFRMEWSPIRAEVARSGELGYTWGTYTVTTRDSDGAEQRRRGKYASIWKRRDDGEWRVVASFDSSDTEDPGVPAAEPVPSSPAVLV